MTTVRALRYEALVSHDGVVPSVCDPWLSPRARWCSRRAGRCRGLGRYRALLDLTVHVRIPALEDGAQFPVERPHSRL